MLLDKKKGKTNCLSFNYYCTNYKLDQKTFHYSAESMLKELTNKFH